VNSLRLLFRFGRPHTIIATSFQVVGVFFIVALPEQVDITQLPVLILTWIACLAANLYVVGLNQITDVAIDRLNKPALPLAHGDLSRRGGWVTTLAAGVLALTIAAAQSRFLLLTLALVMLIGSIYSLPPLRLKQRPLLAAISIALARGVIANVGLYLHFLAALNLPAARTASWLLWAVVFFFGFGLVIALYKDIPDWAGDKHYAIRTFVVQKGHKRIFNAGRWLLTGLYLLPTAVGLSRLPNPDGVALVLSHVAMVLIFWMFSLRTNPAQPASMTRLYLFLWALFYAEYVFLSLYTIVGSTLA
jgi:homogentisate phytyltransferase/homogentisate geranylgeranyltransferase